MIVTCPNCQTRYRVEDTELGASPERRMRCANCGHLWRYSAAGAAARPVVAAARSEPAAPSPVVTEPPAGPTPAAPPPADAPPFRFEVETDPQRYPDGSTGPQRLPVEVASPLAKRRRGQRVAGLSLVVLAVAAVFVAVLARDLVVLVYPPAGQVYEALHLGMAAGDGLQITVASPVQSSDAMTIEGDIVNGAQAAQAVPRLQVTLRDGAGNDLQARVIDAPVKQLQPGGKAHFAAVFDHPSITAVSAVVSFVGE